MVLARRYFVAPVASPSWSRFFEEFHCRGCGAHEASRSRPRGFFEKYVLPRAERRTMGCRIMGSQAGPSALLRLYSSLCSPPIAVFVVPHSSEFPDFPFVKPV